MRVFLDEFRQMPIDAGFGQSPSLSTKVSSLMEFLASELGVRDFSSVTGGDIGASGASPGRCG